jgi:hypothetical protein
MKRVLRPAALALIGAAMASAAATCDSRAAQQNEAWAKSGPHSWLASLEHTQLVETERKWCHIFETKGIDRVSKGIDFGSELFTGDGLHPSVGGIVPGSGFAGGLVYNLERASASEPLRFSGSVEARGSYNGFWTAGAKLDIWGSANSAQDQHIHATIDVEHYSLPQMAYYGQGNSSSVANESLFGLEQTTAGGHIAVPLPGGFSLTGGLAGLWNSTSGVSGASEPSIDRTFKAAQTPALDTPTTYVVWGGGIDWIYPVSPRINGFSSTLTSAYKWFHDTSGSSYSFSRLDAISINRYHPATKVDLGTISLTARLVDVDTSGGNRMPFYLQPTLGGTDINNVDALRSYRDYRFRAPNLLVFQTEYTRTIWGPLALLGFYDTGRVAEQRSDIGFSNFHHSLGAGFIIQVGGAPVFKFYYAWGGGEGSHTTYTLNTNNFTFSAPAGVF